MDFADSTKVVYDRIQKMEPENVSKIIGYLLLQQHSEREMIRLAFCPDSSIYSLISRAKHDLGLHMPIPEADFHFGNYYSNMEGCFGGFDHLERQLDYLSLDEESKGGRRSRVCHYFSKGYCKHGSSCRYFHVHPSYTDEERDVSPGSLEKLEFELTELLRAKRGLPVSIASLPTMYFERYRRNLQADGYLTESQRHGKSGFSLTKLLCRLKNSICVIDRPHGQHSVILAEDVHKYLEQPADKFGGKIPGENQIYLTFPAESSFAEIDVASYFGKFGPVQDVRIPCQQRRMFGFVTFVFPETVKEILAKGNPHFVCSARVLVKPYREKGRLLSLGNQTNLCRNDAVSVPKQHLHQRVAEEEELLSSRDFDYLLDVISADSSEEDDLSRTQSGIEGTNHTSP